MTAAARGWNGQITVDDAFVTITRRGFIARATLGKGEKHIPLGMVAGVQWKPAGPLVQGYLSVTVPGGVEIRSRGGHATQDASRDENAVLFWRNNQADMAQVRDAILADIATRRH